MKENKGFIKGLVIGLMMSVVVLMGSLIFYQINTQALQSAPAGTEQGTAFLDEAALQKVELIKTRIDQLYLNDVEEEDLNEGIYKGLLEGLDDPYSVYYTEEDFVALMETSEGTYCGIGATLSQNSETGVISIVKAFDGSPAKEAGLTGGDIIYKVDGEEVTGLDLETVVTKVKGEEGTKVHLTIVRESEYDYLELDVERRKIEVPTIAYEMKEGNIGYIAIAEFDDVTVQQFKDALDTLEEQGMQSLIVDLRDNPGGNLSAVVEMLQYMVPKGMIVYTEDKYGSREEYKSEGNHVFTKPLALLINGNSASAAEIFAGAVKDYEMGTLVGTTTFGKGIVQRVVSLEDGTAIKLTVSKYYTPKGNNIHGTGIDPDVEVELDAEAFVADGTDNQLEAAIAELQK